MAIIQISGASDDLIEIEGDITEEFYAIADDRPYWLAFSDGTVLSIHYGAEGIWRIAQYVKGSAKFELTQGTNTDDDYTDRATLTGDVGWVVYGSQCVTA